MSELAPSPIAPLIPAVLQTLERAPYAVLSAPTGSGKSTVLPLALLEAPFLRQRKIVMLEPRRVAAVAVAARLAENHGDELGATVGYRMRLERKVSSATRLEVVTEGVLSRIIQHDPELSDVGLLIFDEFHERSLAADLAFVLARDVRESLRPDLRMLFMSATLECEKVSRALDGAPVLTGEGRSFPVAVHYRPRDPRRDLALDAAELVLEAYARESGSILLFLPGEAEIRRAESMLRERLRDPAVAILPLYGKLDLAEQRRAILPCRPPFRKIVLATGIAESSLTIDGVRVVVDSGFTRIAAFDPASGLTRLATVPVSQAAAEQRAGRAGRTEPGAVWRLGTAAEHARREAMRPPEIRNADLSALVLDLAAWGVRDPAAMRWLDPPPMAAWRAGSDLLRMLGALDAGGALTPHGKIMHRSGLAPRLAHMAVRAAEAGQGETGARLAAILDAADCRKLGDCDLEHALRRFDRDPLFARARQLSGQILRQMPAAQRSAPGRYSCGALLALAFPDRVARRRGNMGSLRYLTRGGKGGIWRSMNDLAMHEFLVLIDLENRSEDAEIRLAAALEAWEVEELFGEDFTTVTALRENCADRTLEAVRQRKLGAIVWQEQRAESPNPEELLHAVGALLRRHGLALLELPAELARLRARVAFLRRHDPDGGWPDWSDEGILQDIERILDGFLPARFSKNILREIRLDRALRAHLSYEQSRRLDAAAPETVTLANGRSLRVDYSGDPPILAAKLQWFFGTGTHPALLNGRVPLAVHLLSPANRPVQITSDLPGFWKGSYQLVRNELRGRYPKHDWPEVP